MAAPNGPRAQSRCQAQCARIVEHHQVVAAFQLAGNALACVQVLGPIGVRDGALPAAQPAVERARHPAQLGIPEQHVPLHPHSRAGLQRQEASERLGDRLWAPATVR